MAYADVISVVSKHRIRRQLLSSVLVALTLAGLAFASAAQAAPNTATSWGRDGNGELGNGSTTGNVAVPGAVNVLSGGTQLASGTGDHSLALLADGTLLGWGANHQGQLGLGSTTDVTEPTAIPGVTGAVEVAAGGQHSLALLSDGTVLAWGMNSYGALGNGDDAGPDVCSGNPCGQSPAPVPGLTNVVAIAAGGNHSLALLADGTVRAWGANGSAQLGQNTGGPESCGFGDCGTTPTQVAALSGVVDIAAGRQHSLALLSDGTARGWGANDDGQTGLGSVTSTGCGCQSSPVPVDGLSGAVDLAAGYYHSIALLSNGTAMAWGSNEDGQLGNGTIGGDGCECDPDAAAVTGLSGVTEIASGGYHTLALLSGGTVKAWGFNIGGQLGDNMDGTSSGTPVDAIGLTNVTALGAGYAHSLALVGDKRTLTVSLSGLGAGKVWARGISCSPFCTHSYPEGATVRLRAIADPSTFFAGYSNDCTGTGVCTLTMDEAHAVNAQFGELPGPPTPAAETAAPATGQRSAALEKCLNKKTKKARKKCGRKAKQLPL